MTATPFLPCQTLSAARGQGSGPRGSLPPGGVQEKHGAHTLLSKDAPREPPRHSPLPSSAAGRRKAQRAVVKSGFHRRRDVSLSNGFKTKIARGGLRRFRHLADASIGVTRDAEVGLDAGPGSQSLWVATGLAEDQASSGKQVALTSAGSE